MRHFSAKDKLIELERDLATLRGSIETRLAELNGSLKVVESALRLQVHEELETQFDKHTNSFRERVLHQIEGLRHDLDRHLSDQLRAIRITSGYAEMGCRIQECPEGEFQPHHDGVWTYDLSTA
jgi:hypothetical protein